MRIKQLLETCLEHNLTLKETILLYLLYENDKESLILLKNVVFVDKNQLFDDTSDIINSLIEKGYLECTDLQGTYTSNNLIVTINPFEIFDSERAANEIWKLYPPTIYIHNTNKTIPSKSIDKQEFVTLYKERIGCDEEHEVVLKATKEYSKRDHAEMRIDKFISSEYYKTIKPSDNDNTFMNEII